eukprot:TRINITY_DN1875_c0_g2_i6.p1 TRINITY_DN1875_c0_g2~~TRINITY_DN1875_c0_g2_i6.p1  ORF type:complete len:411 (-),score=128.24 TRINITY_DN1875_c0_g2_i6:134-1366(-)
MRPGFGPTTPAGPPGKGVKPVAPQFFVDPKKGEVNELKILLKNCLSEKDEKKRRDVVKKVIAFMTLGIDVSRLFTEMCMASATSDMIQKKMIYLYLANYAESNASLAIMAINTYLKDCKAADGKTRGLALRSLCSLRFSGAYEYLQPAILEGMRDLDSYVRKTAIMGCVKVYHMNPSLIRNSNIIDTLYGLIKDPDNQVATNAIIALDEILESEGGIAISQKMIVYLLNKIREFNEWGQTLILELVAKYKPKSENELFDILNLLDLGDLTITSPTQPTQPVAAGGSASFTVEELSPFFELDPERFQSAWTDLPECANVTRSLSSAGAANMQSVEQTFAECRFFCIASGEMENQLKFYFYGRLNATNELIFIEVLVDLGARTIHMLFKAEREDLHGLVKFLETVLRTRLII